MSPCNTEPRAATTTNINFDANEATQSTPPEIREEKRSLSNKQQKWDEGVERERGKEREREKGRKRENNVAFRGMNKFRIKFAAHQRNLHS
jgi:hypothetical protein